MLIFPAIDLYEGKAVRLFKGDYAQMTVYSENPTDVCRDFAAAGATHVHLVDLEGAKNGETPNFETVRAIKESCGLFCEIGGGVRNHEVIDRYLSAGKRLDREILAGSLCLLRKNAKNRCKNADLHRYFARWRHARHQLGIVPRNVQAIFAGYCGIGRCIVD